MFITVGVSRNIIVLNLVLQYMYIIVKKESNYGLHGGSVAVTAVSCFISCQIHGGCEYDDLTI